MAYLKDLLEKCPIRIKHMDVEEEFVHDSSKDLMYLKERYTLEQLLSDKWEEVKSDKQIISELEEKVKKLELELGVERAKNGLNTLVIKYPYDTNQCLHEYPMPWLGTVPPTCKKCGKSAGTYPYYITTSGTTTYVPKD